jgi:hypothetical protein
MSKIRLSGTLVTDAEAVFYDAVLSAEQTWQAADKSTQAKIRTADINRHRSIAAAAVTAGAGAYSGHLAGPSRAALFELTGQYA